MAGLNYVSNHKRYRLCSILPESLVAAIRVANDMSINLCPPALRANVALILERMKTAFFTRCRDPVLVRERNEIDRERLKAEEEE